MTSYIPRLASISARSQRKDKRSVAVARARTGVKPSHLNIEYLAGVVPVIRRRLGIAPTFSDEAMFASLTSIAAHATYEERWHAAEASTLGQFLMSHGKDLKGSLSTILALLPKPYL